MKRTLTHIGLDVHKETTAVAILRPGTTVADERTIPTTPEGFRRLVAKTGTKGVVACYEAGPWGYDPHRILANLGVPCDVIAPTLIPRRVGRRVKTDRIDARNLARLHRAGELTAIRVPSPAEEAIRDLIRLREHLKDDRRIALQRIKSFLLRQGQRYPGVERGFTEKHEAWARALRFDQPVAQLTFDHLLSTYQLRLSQLRTITAQIEEAADLPLVAERIRLLRCLRGIDTLAAATLVAEVCDFRQFPSAPAFMSFTGLVPSEHSSAGEVRRGSITHTGNRHVRLILVEASWTYRYRPAVNPNLRRRQEGLPPEAIALSWRAQVRLHDRFARLMARGKRGPVAVTAVARELAGFVWALMQEEIRS